MGKRGAYFFVLDAIIGGAIFVITIILILGSQLNQPESKQTYLLSNDIMNLLTTTKVVDYRDTYVSSLISSNRINNYEQSLFNQIAEFYYQNQTGLAKNFTENILYKLIPEQYGLSYSLGTFVVYNRSIGKLNNSRIVLTSRRITYFALNQTELFGPDISELKIWV